MQNQHGFITALIRNGKEVDDIPETYSIGTYVEITDWGTLDNNLLSITIQGKQRIHLNKTHVLDHNLMSAEFNYLSNLESYESDHLDEDLLSLLQSLHKHPFIADKYPDMDDSSITNVAYKLCELLPASNSEKQQLLETETIHHLFEQLKIIVTRLENLFSHDRP